jgi:DNA-binding MarR family transcriptional regulator
MSLKSKSILSKREFESLSEFRFQIRRFERFSQTAIRRYGITSLQYLVLLHVRGYPGRDYASIGELAKRLQAPHNGVVALVTRCAKRGLIQRRRSSEDRRRVEVRLRAKGTAILTRLAALHRAELLSLRGVFTIPLQQLR